MKEQLEQLIKEEEKQFFFDSDWWINRKKRYELLSRNLSETTQYLDECSETEFYFMSDTFEELNSRFQSQELIDCIERNIKRCKDEKNAKLVKSVLYYINGSYKNEVCNTMKEELDKLIEEIGTLDPHDEYFWWLNFKKKYKIASRTLIGTIEYLDHCSENSLYYMSDIFEELNYRFQSKELIDCIERNIERCKKEDVITALQNELTYINDFNAENN